MLSVVVPVYNEAGNLRELDHRLREILVALDPVFEIVYVDDGSQDSSSDVLRELFEKHKSFTKVIFLSRNFGHQVALTAGLDHAVGDAVISMDADLQHPPEIIPKLVAKWREGFDVVYTIRNYRENVGFFKKVSSRLFYILLKRLSATPVHIDSSDFRLLSRRAANEINKIRERFRFLRGLSSWIGFSQTAVHFDAAPRKTGTSQYSVRKMLRLAIDGVTSFSSVPLYFSALLGFLVSVFSFIYAGIVLYWKFFTNFTIPGWTSIVVLLLFLCGAQLMCLGIIGEYLGKIYDEMKQRPLYVIKETLRGV